jgi:hypothetical protein
MVTIKSHFIILLLWHLILEGRDRGEREKGGE